MTAVRSASAVAIIGIVALLAAGCTRGGGDEAAASPGITDDSMVLGVTSPLSGHTAGPGRCVAAGLNAYLEAGNAAGGFEFGDGKTRKVTLEPFDDGYDPQKALTNFQQMVSDDLFGMVGSLGTPTNLAIMPAAADEEFPQALLLTGATQFSSDQEANPWTIGFLPTYVTEGQGFGQMLVDRGEPLTVATLTQNDDAGAAYLEGLEQAIEGSDVEIVARNTYEATDTSVDAQVIELAESGADVLFTVVFITPLQIGVLQKAQQLGWLPEVFVPSPTSSPIEVLGPGAAGAYPAVYTPVFVKSPADPQFAEDEDVKTFLDDMSQYSSDLTKTIVPHCVWSYVVGATLEEAFTKMTEPTRESFMKAIRQVSELKAPMLLPGIEVDATDPTRGAVNQVLVWRYNGTAYVPVD
ncbi:MAG TPA: ABC transporter substrate-binding protein [Microbacterium sp.]|uniref:ABC transporter substrate-binding protein n=1 Tax=Microbacterium sp. TaxID=51671 RepID=UPI002CEBB1EB|nr:ABC transporter substrate-binding protein [Microbacterium sp.]HWI31798.1 ABC transporter substrate-binding protein [Microbacterium sp.]